MYCPAHFHEDRAEILSALIGQHPLATIVANGPSGLVADHIPLLHVPQAMGFGKLIGHVAKANPLWQHTGEQDLLVIFQGPSHYISPNWYESKQDGGRVVPTWNYAVVHAHATLAARHEADAILDIITRTTDLLEAGQPHPWKVADAPAEFTNRLLDNLVGIELTVHRIQGKWKVSQNQPAHNQRSLTQGLERHGGDQANAMASLVQAWGAK